MKTLRHIDPSMPADPIAIAVSVHGEPGDPDAGREPSGCYPAPPPSRR
jgi:hypothetical protein